MPKKSLKLSPEVAAALASGAGLNVEEVANVQTDEQNGNTELNADGEAASTELNAETTTEANTETAANAEGETEANLEAAPSTPTVPAVDPIVAHLKGELTEVRAELIAAAGAKATLTAELNALKAQNTNLTAAQDAMASVVRLATQRLAVALNSTVTGLDTMEPVALSNLYNQLNADFQKKFPVGGVSRVDAKDAEVKTSTAVINPVLAAARAASKLQK